MALNSPTPDATPDAASGGFDFDLFVIGAGSGGVRAARIAASHGARVGIAEEYRVGGTCVIRGCVPKKLLVYASRFADDFEDAKGFGWTVPAPSFDWPTLIANKDKEIARLEAAYRSTLQKHRVELFETRATIEGPNAVRLAKDGRIVRTRHILIATGGHPHVDPALKGHELAITSNEVFHLKRLPRRTVVQGGGYIALEFASILNGLGSEVTVVYRGPLVLRGFDEDVRTALSAALSERGIKILTSRKITEIAAAGDGAKSVRLDDGSALAADEVLVATGRHPNVTDLGLEALGVKLAANGGIAVDQDYRSSVPSIYAVGDVNNRVNLTPAAIREGHAFADTVFGKKPWRPAFDVVPTAVFTTPEIGTVGLSEDAARAKGLALDVYRTSFRPMRATLAGRAERMMMKLVLEKGSDRVLGVHVLGADAAEIVQMAGIALNLKATKADFDRTMALHPSAAEELVTLREKVAPKAG